MERIVECVPNFSEGRDEGIIKEITDTIEAVAGVQLLDVDPGADTNRTVVTMVGSPEDVAEAAFQAVKRAAQLIDMFTQVIGSWARPVIALAALAVMLSTTLASLDACPRVSGAILQQLMPSMKVNNNSLYLVFLIAQVIGSTLILVFFMKSFKTFIDFATSVAFISAPVLAWFNHRAIHSKEIDPDLQPGNPM